VLYFLQNKDQGNYLCKRREAGWFGQVKLAKKTPHTPDFREDADKVTIRYGVKWVIFHW
jgi:hypothetical protein